MGKIELNQLDYSWSNVEELVLYGFGRSAHGSINQFIEQFNVPFIIDNSDKWIGKKYKGIPILKLNVCKEKLDQKKILILASGQALDSISHSLEKIGLKENENFTDLLTFTSEWYWRFKHKICLDRVVVSLTEKCTFKCRNCGAFMPYYKTPRDYDMQMLCKDIDLLFETVDMVTCVAIIGGEPFLYPFLDKYIEYIGEKYRKKIANIQLISNGSIIPSEKLLKLIKKYDVDIRISNYTRTVPYKEKLNQVKDILHNYGISYYEFDQEKWLNFGFPMEDVCMGETVEECRKHMFLCHTTCRTVHDGRIYYCEQAWSAEQSGLFKLNEYDSIDMRELVDSGNKGKEELINFHIGNIKQGYMSMCKVCKGFGSDNKDVIQGGIQVGIDGK